MPENTEKKERTRKSLENALVQLCKTRSLSEITVSDICDAAGVHKSTFYRYFETKELMVEKMGNEFMELAETTLMQISENTIRDNTDGNSIRGFMMSQFKDKDLSCFLLFSGNVAGFYDRYVDTIKRCYKKMAFGDPDCVLDRRSEMFIDYRTGGVMNCSRLFLQGEYDSIDELAELVSLSIKIEQQYKSDKDNR